MVQPLFAQRVGRGSGPGAPQIGVRPPRFLGEDFGVFTEGPRGRDRYRGGGRTRRRERQVDFEKYTGKNNAANWHGKFWENTSIYVFHTSDDPDLSRRIPNKISVEGPDGNTERYDAGRNAQIVTIAIKGDELHAIVCHKDESTGALKNSGVHLEFSRGLNGSIIFLESNEGTDMNRVYRKHLESNIGQDGLDGEQGEQAAEPARRMFERNPGRFAPKEQTHPDYIIKFDVGEDGNEAVVLLSRADPSIESKLPLGEGEQVMKIISTYGLRVITTAPASMGGTILRLHEINLGGTEPCMECPSTRNGSEIPENWINRFAVVTDRAAELRERMLRDGQRRED